jgi:hypothetical protein
MQLQGNIGIFCGIGGGFLQINLIKSKLFFSFARNFFKMNGAVVKLI